MRGRSKLRNNNHKPALTTCTKGVKTRRVDVPFIVLYLHDSSVRTTKISYIYITIIVIYSDAYLVTVQQRIDNHQVSPHYIISVSITISIIITD